MYTNQQWQTVVDVGALACAGEATADQLRQAEEALDMLIESGEIPDDLRSLRPGFVLFLWDALSVAIEDAIVDKEDESDPVP